MSLYESVCLSVCLSVSLSVLVSVLPSSPLAQKREKQREKHREREREKEGERERETYAQQLILPTPHCLCIALQPSSSEERETEREGERETERERERESALCPVAHPSYAPLVPLSFPLSKEVLSPLTSLLFSYLGDTPVAHDIPAHKDSHTHTHTQSFLPVGFGKEGICVCVCVCVCVCSGKPLGWGKQSFIIPSGVDSWVLTVLLPHLSEEHWWKGAGGMSNR